MDINSLLQKLDHADTNVYATLVQARDPLYESLWKQDSQLYRAFGKQLISAGHHTTAFELTREGVTIFPDDQRLLHLRALALARGGNIEKADEFAEELLKRDDLDPEIRVEALSLRGRLLKDGYQKISNASHRVRYALESARLYFSAYEKTDEWYPAINAASMFCLADEQKQSHQLALEVFQQLQQRYSQSPDTTDYWLFASLGEACLLLGKSEEAADWYQRAVTNAGNRVGDIASMRRQLHLLQERIQITDELWQLFQVGPVVVFAGHPFDNPFSNSSSIPEVRFPVNAGLESAVREAIAAELEKLQPAVGYCAGGCGSDLLFAEWMVEHDKELHVVLPFDLEDYYLARVDYGLSEMAEYRERFDAILNRSEVHVHYGTEEKYLGDDELFDFVSSFAQGLALTRASELGADVWGMAVLDENSPSNVEGTRYFLKKWSHRSANQRVINLRTIRQKSDARPPEWWNKLANAKHHSTKQVGYRREIKVMLFADVKNYSRLTDDHAPEFFVTFVNQILEVVHDTRNCPVLCNTWGDGLFLVQDCVVKAAEFALQLLEKMEAIKWEKMGLPADTTVRIGMHAGPVYPHWDKLIGRQNFYGTHVNRAARIEPKTLPGCVYTSEQYAALLAVEPDHDFVCSYLGMETLGKEHDRFRCALYRLTRKGN